MTRCFRGLVMAAAFAAGGLWAAEPAAAQEALHDSHFHYLNYNQDLGMPIATVRGVMTHGVQGDSRTDYSVTRSTLFGIPLQQRWDPSALLARDAGHGDGSFTWGAPSIPDDEPVYYLPTHSELYYYSGVDPLIAEAYCDDVEGLTARDGAPFWDPSITGFNPADVHGADHIVRMMTVYPGIFRAIGEFTIHKEAVATKIAGATPSFDNEALHEIIHVASRLGLVVILHSDMYSLLDEGPEDAAYYDETKLLLKDVGHYFKNYKTPGLLWAHTGIGRFAPKDRTIQLAHFDRLQRILDDPLYNHVGFDIAWDFVARFIRGNPAGWANLYDNANRGKRFVWGSDSLSPTNQQKYTDVIKDYDAIFRVPYTQAPARLMQRDNYAMIFDDPLRRYARGYFAHRTGATKWNCKRDTVVPPPSDDWFKGYDDLYPKEERQELLKAIEKDVDEVIGLYPRAVRAVQVK
ncbi:hypothetical protein [Oceanibacterium hippocampi]|uniref:Amidohydrolase n=1 Tax=Oceanibacterium hippocampi TaxID=745714 RepID=A0A1Y5RA10_9PROT|nr:hypothetical protein [Oceanibacterium hippocampi]SLN12575.1 hypothetical protein OCH7691_00168 [Oceanibacterium hippocampi]